MNEMQQAIKEVEATIQETNKLVERLLAENNVLRTLLKEQLKISGKCCYVKAPAYSQIRAKLIEMGYGPEIVTEVLGEDV